MLGGVLSGGTLPVFLVLSRLIKLPAASKNLFAVLPDQAAFGPARLVKMLFWLAVASHLISCGFLYIGAIPLAERPGLAWLQALYWTVTTIATIGYGNIVPDRTSAVQLGYTIMAELVGVGMFGFIIGNIASLIANLDSAKAQHRGKMEAVGAFIRAVGYCDLYSLSKSDFEEVLVLYPAFAQSIRAQAEERKKKNMK